MFRNMVAALRHGAVLSSFLKIINICYKLQSYNYNYNIIITNIDVQPIYCIQSQYANNFTILNFPFIDIVLNVLNVFQK